MTAQVPSGLGRRERLCWATVWVVLCALTLTAAATACELPGVYWGSGCRKVSNRDVVRVLGAGARVTGFGYTPRLSGAIPDWEQHHVLPGAEWCGRYVRGWKDGDQEGNGAVVLGTWTGSDAAAVFQRERAKAIARDPKISKEGDFFLSDAPHGDEAFCFSVSRSEPTTGVLLRYGEKLVYADAPNVRAFNTAQNCDRAQQLARTLR